MVLAKPGRRGATPNLIVIGAMKCGTSSLHEYLALHPEIQMSVPKELNFFISQDSFDPSPYIVESSERALFGEYSTWDWGVDWYRDRFDAASPVRGESSVAYSFPWYPATPARIAKLIPEAKLILMVRDPIERIVSHYHQNWIGGREWRSLSHALASPHNAYLPLSRYGSLLATYRGHFAAERILVVQSEKLRSERAPTMRRIFEFLEVDPDFHDERMEIEWNPTVETPEPSWGRTRREAVFDRLRRSELVRDAALRLGLGRFGGRGRLTRLAGRDRPPLPIDLRLRLLAELEPEIAALEHYTGWDLNAWRNLEPVGRDGVGDTA